LDKSDRIPIDVSSAIASDDGLIAAFRFTVATLRDRFVTGGGRICIPAVVQPFRPMPEGHLHSGIEVFFQAVGSGSMQLRTGHVPFREGDVLIIPRGIAHKERPYREGPFWNFVSNMVGGHVSLHITGGLPNDDWKMRRRTAVATHDVGRLHGYLADAVSAMEAGRDTEHPLLRGLVLAYLALLVDVLDNRVASRGAGDPLVDGARLLIIKYLTEPRLSVGWLARLLRVSSDHLSRRFRAVTGQAPLAAITEQRVALAKTLLADPSLGVGEVARASGYGDAAYFTRVFTRHAGCNPSAWRLRSEAAAGENHPR
jgi:AraC-like DNA-binding protein